MASRGRRGWCRPPGTTGRMLALAGTVAAILSAAMLCAHLGLSGAAAKIEQAVADDVLARASGPATRTTAEIGDAVAGRVGG